MKIVLRVAFAFIIHQINVFECQIIRLYEEGELGKVSQKEMNESSHISRVHVPTITTVPYNLSKYIGTAVIICPGGSYSRLSFENEGMRPAKWFGSHGVVPFVLKYRLKEYGHPAPLRDILRAIRLIKSKSLDYVISDIKNIGIIGFSAGGHLAASSATLFNSFYGNTKSSLDEISARPDFAILVYPVITMMEPYTHLFSRKNLLHTRETDDEMIRLYSIEQQVSASTPPILIFHWEDDIVVPIQNSLLMYQSLKEFNVSSEMHLYDVGGHGFGLAKGTRNKLLASWPDRMEDWLRYHKWIV